MQNTSLNVLIFCLLTYGTTYTMPGRVITPTAKQLGSMGRRPMTQTTGPVTSSTYRRYFTASVPLPATQTINAPFNKLGQYGNRLSLYAGQKSNALKGILFSLFLKVAPKSYAQKVNLENNTKIHALISGFLGSLYALPKKGLEIQTASIEKEMPLYPNISEIELSATNVRQDNYSHNPSALVLDELVDYLLNNTDIGTKTISDLLVFEPYITRVMRALEKQHATASPEGISMAKKVLESLNTALARPSLEPDEAIILYHLADTILDVYKLRKTPYFTAGKEFGRLRRDLELLKFSLQTLGLNLGSSLNEIRLKCQEKHAHLQIAEAREAIIRILHLTFPVVE